jgi:dihydroorotate dehydrogenase
MQTVKIGSVVWPGPVGIGAGLIKNGAMMLDFAKHASSVEIGSITRHLREGNSGRTVWKLLPQQSMRHNAGLPNYGAEHLAEDLLSIQDQMTIPWGINIAVSPGIGDSQEASIDIRETMGILLASGLEPDWITLNVASSDTDDSVELLSEPERVKAIIASIQTEFVRYDKAPLWLKIGPGMSNDSLAALADLSVAMGVETLVCGNTYNGWCGNIVHARADAVLWWLKQYVGDKLSLIGLGGVMTGKDVKHSFELGANAVQVVSALLMRGRTAAKIIESEI